MNLNDLISREELAAKLRAFYGVKDGKVLSVDAIAALSAIDEADAVEAEPVRHSAWLIKKLPNCGYYECSTAVCTRCNGENKKTEYVHEHGLSGILTTPIKTKFCPNCGARMQDVK